MNIDDLFKIDTTKEATPQMTIKEFVEKTRAILKKIDSEYGVANQWNMVEDEEHEQQDCENCKGECIINRNGKELQCQPYKSEGECFVLEFAHESFVEEIENIMFHDEKYSFYELLYCEITNEEQK